MDNQLNRNLQGRDQEKAGNIEKAIELYEDNIQEGFEGNHPYDRLAIIYRTQEKIEEEIRVLNRAIEVFSELSKSSPRADVKPKLEKFKKRLEKVRKKYPEIWEKFESNNPVPAKVNQETTEEDEKSILNIDKQEFLEKWRYFVFDLHGFSKKEFKQIQKQSGSPYEADILYTALNELVIEAVKALDFNLAGILYHEMAMFLDDEGRDPIKMLFYSKQMQLRHLEQHGANKVMIEARDEENCESCKKLGGNVYRFREAAQDMPIPNTECTYKRNSKYPFCRCKWISA